MRQSSQQLLYASPTPGAVLVGHDVDGLVTMTYPLHGLYAGSGRPCLSHLVNPGNCSGVATIFSREFSLHAWRGVFAPGRYACSALAAYQWCARTAQQVARMPHARGHAVFPRRRLLRVPGRHRKSTGTGRAVAPTPTWTGKTDSPSTKSYEFTEGNVALSRVQPIHISPKSNRSVVACGARPCRNGALPCAHGNLQDVHL